MGKDVARPRHDRLSQQALGVWRCGAAGEEAQRLGVVGGVLRQVRAERLVRHRAALFLLQSERSLMMRSQYQRWWNGPAGRGTAGMWRPVIDDHSCRRASTGLRATTLSVWPRTVAQAMPRAARPAAMKIQGVRVI